MSQKYILGITKDYQQCHFFTAQINKSIINQKLFNLVDRSYGKSLRAEALLFILILENIIELLNYSSISNIYVRLHHVKNTGLLYHMSQCHIDCRITKEEWTEVEMYRRQRDQDGKTFGRSILQWRWKYSFYAVFT